MESTPASGAVCGECGQPLSGEGRCLVCLLRAGLEPATPDEPATTLFGDFEIARRDDGSRWELGRGATGITYRAVDRVLHRSVALKVINPPEGAGPGCAVRERFLREVRAAAALRHGNVVGIFQYGALPDAGSCYCAMELVEGETLATKVRRDGPLDVPVALDIASQVTAALTAAASRDLIHRDLKPGNLMLTPREAPEGGFAVKVVDFGLAKAVAAAAHETDLTQGGFVGTLGYASPEQLQGSAVDARSDLYSLGVTLWFGLTGQLPTAGQDPTAPQLGELPLAQLAARKTPAAVVALLRSLLAADPALRPASARELLETIEGLRRGMAKGPALPTRRPAHRPALALLWGPAAAALLAAAAVIAWSHFWPRGAVEPDAGPHRKSIAVLPFANLSEDPANAFFTDGVQDEILTDLSRIAELKVISRTSVMPYKTGPAGQLRKIAEELGVAYIVEGTVQRAGDRVRVSAQLIDARHDFHLWADHYERKVADVFGIQTEIAQAIASALKAKLSPEESSAIGRPPTSDLAAYEAYLQGKKQSRNEMIHQEANMRQAARLFEEATARDPRFFAAWCELAQANLYLYWFNFDHTPARLARAETAVRAAVELRPGAGEIHLVGGILRYWGYRDFDGALTELQAAARALPNDSEVSTWLSLVLRRRGEWEESERQLGRAIALDPRNAGLHVSLAGVQRYRCRFAEMDRSNAQAVALDPANQGYAFWQAFCKRWAWGELEPTRQWLNNVSADNEEWSDGAALVAACLALDEGDYPAAGTALARYRPQTISDGEIIWPRQETEGMIARLSGDAAGARIAFLAARQRAQEMLNQRPGDSRALIVLAKIDALLGRKAEAVWEGEAACAALPVSADAIDGAYLQRELSGVYAECGDLDRAIAILRVILSQPVGPGYGDLRFDHRWDPLRGDARFQALLTERAPANRLR